MDLEEYDILLASGSPRRKELLKLAGLNFTVVKNDVEESYPKDLSVNKVAEFLAVKKSLAFKLDNDKNEILITADTIVELEGKEYGKPESKEDCIEMLMKLSNKVHNVFTGVCLRSVNYKNSFTCQSIVKFSTIDKKEAEWYFDTNNPMDKAGSYGIQDWIGMCKVESINGSYTNILGLPLAQTLEQLNLFIKNK